MPHRVSPAITYERAATAWARSAFVPAVTAVAPRRRHLSGDHRTDQRLGVHLVDGRIVPDVWMAIMSPR